MHTIHGPAVRRSKRVVTKRRASVVVNLGSRPELVPCVIVDISEDGFRLRTSFPLRRGQLVEVIANEESKAIPCRVVWVGARGSKHEGQAGLETVAP